MCPSFLETPTAGSLEMGFHCPTDTHGLGEAPRQQSGVDTLGCGDTSDSSSPQAGCPCCTLMLLLRREKEEE